MLIVSNFLLWVIVALLTVAVLALARQVGVLYERVAPMGALVTGGGPQAGDAAPHVHATAFDGSAIAIGAGHMAAQRTLLLFVAPNCPVCRKIIPLAKSVAAREDMDLVFIGDGPDAEVRAMIDRYALGGYRFANAPAVGLAFHVGKLPYAVLIRADGIIAAKGLVSSREHLESLAVADESGFPSAQAYLRSIDAAKAA